VRDFSQTILNSIHDNNHYMEEDIKNVFVSMVQIELINSVSRHEILSDFSLTIIPL
jgi:hypothetical protein